MSRFRHTKTDVVVSVDDSKDARFTAPLWESADKPAKADSKPTAKKSASK